MGSFSWTKAEKSTKFANVAIGSPYKLLIPAEFGGGYIIDHYRNYGIIYDSKKGKTYDIYELLAFWNFGNCESHKLHGAVLKYDQKEFPLMKEKDQYTDENREIGIDIGCYDNDMDSLLYPLKLVSVRYKGTYEECDGISYYDPWQGYPGLTWERYDEERKR